MAAVQFTLYEDLSIPEGALYSIDVLEKLNFEKPHVPRQTEDSLEILDSCELQELLDEEVRDTLVTEAKDGVDAAYFDEDERSDSEVVNKGFPRHESVNGRDIPVRRRNIENLISEVMKEINCSSIVSDIEVSAVSNEIFARDVNLRDMLIIEYVNL